MMRFSFLLVLLVSGVASFAQENAISWEASHVQHGWVYSHPKYHHFLADTAVVVGANHTTGIVGFMMDTGSMNTTHYYFKAPLYVQKDEEFAVVIGIPGKDVPNGRIEWYSKYVNFPAANGKTSGFYLEYFRVDSNVKHIYDRGVLRELRGVDFSDMPVRLILDDTGKPVVFETYDPRTDVSIGTKMEFDGATSSWKQIKSTELVPFQAQVVYPDSIIMYDFGFRQPCPTYVQRPIQELDEVWIYKSGLAHQVVPMKHKTAGSFILAFPEATDSVAFKFRGMKQVIHVNPNGINSTFMGGVTFFKTDSPLLPLGPTLTYYKWDNYRGHVFLDYARFNKDGVVDSLGLMDFKNRYAGQLTFTSDFTCSYSFLSEQQADDFISKLKMDPAVNIITPILSDIGRPGGTYFFKQVTIQVDPSLSEAQVLEKIGKLGFRIIAKSSAENYTIEYKDKVLGKAFVQSLNDMWRLPGFYAVYPNYFFTREVEFNN